MDPDAYEIVCRAMGAMNLVPGLGTITCPVDVLVGEEDYATPPEHARLLAEQIPQAQLTVIPAVGHLGILERTDDYLDALRLTA